MLNSVKTACSCPENLSHHCTSVPIPPLASSDDLITKTERFSLHCGNSALTRIQVHAQILKGWYVVKPKRVFSKGRTKQDGKLPLGFAYRVKLERGEIAKWKMAICQVAKCPFSCLLVVNTPLHHSRCLGQAAAAACLVLVVAKTCFSCHKT